MKEAFILDFDGVTAITEHLWIEYVNKKYGINTKKVDYCNGMTLEGMVNKLTGLNLTFEEFYLDFTQNFTMSFEIHHDVSLLPDAAFVIKELSRKYGLFLSTARNSLGREVIKYILKRHDVAKYFNGYHFVYSLTERNEFIKRPKTDFISSFQGRVAYFMDDSDYEIEKSKSLVPSILFGGTNKSVVGAWSSDNWLDMGDLVL